MSVFCYTCPGILQDHDLNRSGGPLSVFRAIRRKKSTNEKTTKKKYERGGARRRRAPSARSARGGQLERAEGAHRARGEGKRERRGERGKGKGEREGKERRANEVPATMKPGRNREHPTHVFVLWQRFCNKFGHCLPYTRFLVSFCVLL